MIKTISEKLRDVVKNATESKPNKPMSHKQIVKTKKAKTSAKKAGTKKKSLAR